MKKRTDISGSDGLQGFAYDRLGLTKWKKLDEIFKAVEAGHRKILIRSCNGAGKTAALAAICNWKRSCLPMAICFHECESHRKANLCVD